MSIEGRLESLTHSVELLAGMQVESERRMTRLAETMTELATRTTRLEESMVTLVDGLALLTRVTVDHAGRIENLEHS